MAMPELVQILRAQPGPFPPRPCRYRVCPRALSSVSPRCVILKLIQSMNARSVIVQLVASIVGSNTNGGPLPLPSHLETAVIQELRPVSHGANTVCWLHELVM
uniref:Uncharacterized protein n=1 Tax=Oryza meridionalis TaxID=40149 RepID=A0A0E0E2A4_9ORYZ